MIRFSSTRHGGVSVPPFASLNCSYGVGDQPLAVAENRGRLKKELGLSVLLSARQTHGSVCFVAEERITEDLEVDGFDALMTSQVGVGLMIQQADCQAVTLYDPVCSVIAAIHSGWQGSVLDIIGKTVQVMTDRYNVSPEDIQAYISPSLGPCCAEFVNYLVEFPPSFLDFQVKEKYFDFWQISRMQLMQAGVEEKQIEIAGCCTSCSTDHFSYRRSCREEDGRTGRCATVIALTS